MLPTLCERLGYRADTRALIINADDFGMCQAENAATMEGLLAGVYTSSTVMVPCAWFSDAAAFARRSPGIGIGVHLTHTSEWDGLRWGAVDGAASSLVDDLGYFHADVPSVYASASLEDVERESRAQIERAAAAGIDVTHLDSHMGTMQLHPEYHALYVRLAAEYGLPVRSVGRRLLHQMGMEDIARQMDSAGVLSPDTLFIGGPAHAEKTAAYWTGVFERLQPGVTEVYVHAGIDTPEFRAACPAWEQRVADHAFFRAPSTTCMLDELGIVRTTYRALRSAQRAVSRGLP